MQPSSPPRRPSDCGRQQRECIANNLGRIVNAGYLAVADRLPECGRFHHWRGYADDIDAASPKLGPERFRQIEDETLDPRINGDTGLTTQRSEEHTSELQSLMRISYAVFCLKKKKQQKNITHNTQKP